MKNINYWVEAEKIGNYLLPIPIQDSEKNTYTMAMLEFDIQLSEYEQMLWNTMLESRWKMACVDGGLALLEPSNKVRRKLFTMLAILEASPNYTMYFFSRNFSFFYLFKMVFVSIRSILRAIIGIIFIKIIKKKCN